MRVVVVGGGIAGFTCARTLAALKDRYEKESPPSGERNNLTVTLVTATSVLRAVTHIAPAGRSKLAEELRVSGKEIPDAREALGEGVGIVRGLATRVEAPEGTEGGKLWYRPIEGDASDADEACMEFDKVVLCTGARPKNPFGHLPADDLRRLFHTIRDDSTSDGVRSLLAGNVGDCDARVAVVGNGGIAMEVVHELATRGTVSGTSSDGEREGKDTLPGFRVTWAVREDHAGNAFFDERASHFLLPDLASSADAPFVRQQARAAMIGAKEAEADDKKRKREGGDDADAARETVSRLAGHEASAARKSRIDMLFKCEISGAHVRRVGKSAGKSAGIEFDSYAASTSKGGADGEIEPRREGSDIERAFTDGVEEPWPLVLHFSDGTLLGCSFALFAIGVEPCTELSVGGDMSVDREMRIKGFNGSVHAAGDCCTIDARVLALDPTKPTHWHQMKLWTQARTEGSLAAHCALGLSDSLLCGHNFDLFAHATRFFGFKCVFLGDYCPSGEMTEIVRCVPGRQFVRFVLEDGRLVGAVLIGDTDLEETAENLIMDGIDISTLGNGLLDPANDLEDYFD